MNKIKSLLKSIFHFSFSDKTLGMLQFLVIIVFSLMPVLLSYPYRVNIYVTWEGAYRMYLGQMPYYEYGFPLGVGFWLTPFIFFKIFGPYMITLVKAQAFLNLVSLLSIRSMYKWLRVNNAKILLILLLNCISFVLINFWPWYNHTVYVFQVISLNLVVIHMFSERNWHKYLALFGAAFFAALAFFTKQDGGGFAIILSGALILYNTIVTKKILPLILFVLFTVLVFLAHILPFVSGDFGYWFNHGQPPHYSRVNAWDIITMFFEQSLWIKFYLVIVVIITVNLFRKGKEVFFNRKDMVFVLVTLGILLQVLVIQVTSFSPPTGTLYYHTFAIAFILAYVNFNVDFRRLVVLVPAIMLLFVWYSENYWKYSGRFLFKYLPKSLTEKPNEGVSINSWEAESDSVAVPIVWVPSELASLKKITIPEDTKRGIDNIFDLPVVKQSKGELKVLNMTELTSLALDIGFVPPHDKGQPLFYHKGVCFFDREVEFLCNKVKNAEFDLILFERMDYVDNFFPYAVRDCALEHYKKVDEFEGPTGYGNRVEVYIKKVEGDLVEEAVKESEAIEVSSESKIKTDTVSEQDL